MADPAAIVSSINTYQPDLRQALGAQADPFFQQVAQLFAQAVANSADLDAQNRAGDALLGLVGQYPAAAGLLRTVDPATFGTLAPSTDRDAVPDDSPAAASTTVVAPPGVTGDPGGSLAPLASPPAPVMLGAAPVAPAAPAQQPTPVVVSPMPPVATPAPAVNTPAPIVPAPAPLAVAPLGGDGAAPAAPAAPAPAPATPAMSTPPPKEARPVTNPFRSATDANESIDDRLRTLKEWVSAVLGVLLMVGTVILAFIAAFRTTNDYQQAKDVLLVLSGLAGVVLGYYFGRIPSEARADQAQKTAADAQQVAADAQSQSRALTTQADALADQVGGMIDQTRAQAGAAGTRGVGDSADHVAQLQLLQQALRALARQGRA